MSSNNENEKKLKRDLNNMVNMFKKDAETKNQIEHSFNIGKLQFIQFNGLIKAGFNERQALIICATQLHPNFPDFLNKKGE